MTRHDTIRNGFAEHNTTQGIISPTGTAAIKQMQIARSGLDESLRMG